MNIGSSPMTLLVILGGIILLGLWILSLLFPGSAHISLPEAAQHPPRGDEQSKEILRQRYLRGEISKDEFEEECRHLEKK
jgi:uncharacterized membrane protein